MLCVAAVRSVFSVPRAGIRPLLDLRNAVSAPRVNLERPGERHRSARAPVPRGDIPDQTMPRVQPQLTAVPVMRVTGEGEEERRASARASALLVGMGTQAQRRDSALAPVKLVDTVAQVRAPTSAQGRVQQEDSEMQARRLANALARVLLVGMAVQVKPRTNALGSVLQEGIQRSPHLLDPVRTTA